MDYLSLAGERWARRHKTKISEIKSSDFFGRIDFARKRIDDSRNSIGDVKKDLLFRRESRWLLIHRFDSPLYREHLSGHAKLLIKRELLPETVLSLLYRSKSPLSSIVELPSRCPIGAANPRIIRAVNKNEGLELLLTIDWRPIG